MLSNLSIVGELPSLSNDGICCTMQSSRSAPVATIQKICQA